MKGLLSPSELLLIADDLTGACDVGAEFLGTGHRVQVALSVDLLPSDREGFCSINTQSRRLLPADAAASVKEAVRLASSSTRFVLKKIDTALRGNIGAEIEAAIHAFDAPLALLMPAVPCLGRVTIGGVQWFRGIPAHLTEAARDPSSPSTESNVASLLSGTSLRPALVPIATVRSGKAGEAAERLVKSGHRAIIVDAEFDSQLDLLAVDIVERFGRAVIAGSLGIASAISGLVKAGGHRIRNFERSKGTAFVFVGSAHPVSVEQVKRVAASARAAVFRVGVAQRLIEEMTDAISSGSPVVIAAPPDWDGAPGTAQSIMQELRRLGQAISRRFEKAGIGLVGGECAFEVGAALGIERIELSHDISSFVHAGRIDGGDLNGHRVAVKSGSVGEPECIIKMLSFLAGARDS